MNRQKGFTPILVLVVVLVVAAVAGVYYLGTQKNITSFPIAPVYQIPQSTTIPTTSDKTTSSLQVYNNATYNYSLKIPADWTIDKQNAAQNNDSLVFMYSGNYKTVGNTQVPSLSKGSMLEILASKGDKSYDDLVTQESSDTTYIGKQEVMVGGERATMWISKNAYNISGQAGYKYAFYHNEVGYTILIISAVTNDSLPQEIISTFKFTN